MRGCAGFGAWRDKQGREIDFVMPGQRGEVDVIECKWTPSAFDRTALEVFRRYYPKGRNWLLTPSAPLPHERRFGSHEVTVCTPSGLLP